MVYLLIKLINKKGSETKGYEGGNLHIFKARSKMCVHMYKVIFYVKKKNRKEGSVIDPVK